MQFRAGADLGREGAAREHLRPPASAKAQSVRRYTLVPLCWCLLAIASTAPSFAGTYEVVGCDETAGQEGSGGWTPVTSGSPLIDVTAECPSAGRYSGLFVRDSPGAASTTPG